MRERECACVRGGGKRVERVEIYGSVYVYVCVSVCVCACACSIQRTQVTLKAACEESLRGG